MPTACDGLPRLALEKWLERAPRPLHARGLQGAVAWSVRRKPSNACYLVFGNFRPLSLEKPRKNQRFDHLATPEQVTLVTIVTSFGSELGRTCFDSELGRAQGDAPEFATGPHARHRC
jgi:hypothetical protein